MSTELETLNAEIRNAEALHHQALEEYARAKNGQDTNHRSLTLRNERQSRSLLEDLYEQKAQVQLADARDSDPPLTENELRIYEQAYQAGHAAGRLETKLGLLRILGNIITD